MPKLAIDAAILANRRITDDVYEVILSAPEIAGQAVPGQFIHLKITKGEPLLRRPISISNVDLSRGTVSLIYRVVGKGTAALAELKRGNKINCLGPLGSGFDLSCERSLLVGGGMGIAPLILLAQRLGTRHTDILLGGRNQEEMFWRPMFAPFVHSVFITTDDGSLGMKGFTIDLLPELIAKHEYDRIFVCGPQMMMEGVAKLAAVHHIPCQVSLEQYMACGVGACLSCTCESTGGGKRKKVCTDGPVFWAEEVL